VSLSTFATTGPSGIAASNYSFGRKIWSDGCLGIEPGVVEITLAEGKGLPLR
jgi:L-cystine uptake protein TcyP (sodium:dicarboxylate symporter family)